VALRRVVRRAWREERRVVIGSGRRNRVGIKRCLRDG
jgi:hypothetical protein